MKMKGFRQTTQLSIMTMIISIVIAQQLQQLEKHHSNNNNKLTDFSIHSVHEFIRAGGSCAQVVDFYLERAYRYNPMLNAIISFNPRLKSEAIELDELYNANRRRHQGRYYGGYANGTMKGRLHCVPVLVKDNVDVKEMPTTGGIKALRYSIPNKDALVVKRLRDEGALIVAKTNLAELGAGERYDSEVGGTCHNPFDLDKSCGTSSTGTGASVASGMGVIGIGTDTTGSILFPATFNGVWGLRPPIDADNRILDGVVSLNSIFSIDAVGPMAKHLDDLILAYSIMHPLSSSSSNSSKNEYAITSSNLGVAVAADSKQAKSSTNKYSIGMIKEFNDYFAMSISIGDFDYQVEDAVKRAMRDMQTSLSDVATFTEIALTNDDMDDIALIFEALVDDKCTANCVRRSLDLYLGDTGRFDVDAPYKTFDELTDSPLLNRFWATFFRPPLGTREIGLSAEQLCTKSCEQFVRIQQRAMKMVDRWLAATNSSIILTPTISTPDYIHDRTDDPFVTLIPVFTVAGMPALSMPIGYTPSPSFSSSSSSSSKKLRRRGGKSESSSSSSSSWQTIRESSPEVPMGVLLWTRSLEDAFAIGKHFESVRASTIRRLPPSTPLLDDLDQACSSSNIMTTKISLFQSLCLVILAALF